MDVEVDLIEFRVPHENNKTIFIWDILPMFSEAYIYDCLCNVYSEFGALYLVKVCQNAAVVEPGFYALVKFYSHVQASKAQRATDKRCLFQSSPLKVRLSTKQNPSFPSSGKPLSHAKCQDLSNYYLGYNGWCTRIITLKDLSNCAELSGEAEAADSQGAVLKFGCVAELTFPQHGVSCQGVGVAEEMVDLARGPEDLWKRGKLMKWAKDKAVVGAFEKVLLMVLGNGKVAVEIKSDEDRILPDEDFEGVVKVNDICRGQSDSWGEGEEEEDLPWDFTVDLSH